MLNQSQQLQEYRESQQKRHEEQIIRNNRNSLASFIDKVNEFDKEVKNFKDDFYTIYSKNTFIETVEIHINRLGSLSDEADQLIELIPDMKYIKLPFKDCKQLLDDILNNQSLLSKSCYELYVVPLIRIFWNFKLELDQYIKYFPAEGKLIQSDLEAQISNKKQTIKPSLNLKDLSMFSVESNSILDDPNILKTIESHLPFEDKISFSFINRFFNTIVKDKIKDEFDAIKLLKQIDMAEESQALQLIDENPRSLFYKVESFKDHYGRKFNDISAWELVLWLLDFQRINKMLQKLEKILSTSDEPTGHQLISLAISQYTKLKENGITYHLDDMTVVGSRYFDLQPLIGAYDNYLHPPALRSEIVDPLWCGAPNSVGMLQRSAPVWLLQFFFGKNSFAEYDKATNIDYKIKSSPEITSKIKKLFAPDSKFGYESEYVLCRGLEPNAGEISVASPGSVPPQVVDHGTVKKIAKVRIKAFEELQTKLESLVSDNSAIIKNQI